MSTDGAASERVAALQDGVFCYVHLWAAPHKHVELKHEEIISDIGLWDDHQGGYFAAFTAGNRRMLAPGQSYVCAIGEEGPAVGQLSRIPPCTPVQIGRDALTLLNALSLGGSQSADSAVKQIALIAGMIDRDLPADKKRKSAH